MATLILSDIHFGNSLFGVSSASMLRGLLPGVRRLVLNGDTAELSHPRRHEIAERETDSLRTLCDAHDVALELITGNHDPHISETHHLLLADGRICITHGHLLRRALASQQEPLAQRMATAWSVNPRARGVCTNLVRWATGEPDAIVRLASAPLIAAEILWYRYRFPGLVARFGRRVVPDARYLVVGHTHHPGAWRFGEQTVINTGSFGFPGRPMGLLLRDHVLEMQAIRRRDDLYVRDVTPLARYDLGATTPRM